MVFYVENNLLDNRDLILKKMKEGAARYVNRTNGLQKDVADLSTKKPANMNEADDGKISFGEKIKNFGKGLIAPIKSVFSSPKNMLLTALAAAGTAGLIAVTGGAAAPVLVAAGLIGGGIQIGKGIYNQVNAKTDDEAKKAWQTIGTGTFVVGTSAVAAKPALKTAGVNTEGMSFFGAIKNCITSVPKNITKSISNISAFVKNIGSSANAAVNALPENSTNTKIDNLHNNSDIIEGVEYKDITDYSNSSAAPIDDKTAMVPVKQKEYSPFNRKMTVEEYFTQKLKQDYQNAAKNQEQLLLGPGQSTPKKTFFGRVQDFFEMFGIFFKKNK